MGARRSGAWGGGHFLPLYPSHLAPYSNFMKSVIHHTVRSAKPSMPRPAKKAAKRPRPVRGDDAVALAIGRALLRKPRINPALLAAFQANRDLCAS